MAQFTEMSPYPLPAHVKRVIEEDELDRARFVGKGVVVDWRVSGDTERVRETYPSLGSDTQVRRNFVRVTDPEMLQFLSTDVFMEESTGAGVEVSWTADNQKARIYRVPQTEDALYVALAPVSTKRDIILSPRDGLVTAEYDQDETVRGFRVHPDFYQAHEKTKSSTNLSDLFPNIRRFTEAQLQRRKDAARLGFVGELERRGVIPDTAISDADLIQNASYLEAQAIAADLSGDFTDAERELLDDAGFVYTLAADVAHGLTREEILPTALGLFADEVAPVGHGERHLNFAPISRGLEYNVSETDERGRIISEDSVRFLHFPPEEGEEMPQVGRYSFDVTYAAPVRDATGTLEQRGEYTITCLEGFGERQKVIFTASLQESVDIAAVIDTARSPRRDPRTLPDLVGDTIKVEQPFTL